MNANQAPDPNAKGMAFPTNTDKVTDGLSPDEAIQPVSKVSITISVGSMVIESFADGTVAVKGDRVEPYHGSNR